MYKPICKPNQVICGTGQVAIATGWTPKEAIAGLISPSEFAAIGQLYSPTRGISFLIRNLLYNPHVRYLIILNATKADNNAGGCRCLLDFFQHGFTLGKSDTGRDCWVIKSKIPGYIDLEIPESALNLLRESLTVEYCDSVKDAIERSRSLDRRSPLPPWGEPLEFDLVELSMTVLPGSRYGHRIEGKTIAETWVKVIHRIKTTGTIRPTVYDCQWQELIDLMAVVTDEPEDFYFPEPNYLPCDRAFIQEYIPQILDDAPYQQGVKYTYGQRLRSWFGQDQIERVINKLVGEIDAASAVMSLWDVKDHEINEVSQSAPCLNHIWVRIVDRELSLTATFRSNDMFSAWPANAMGLRALQKHILDRIVKQSSHKLKIGPLITVSQSAHIYDDCWENADKLIQSQYVAICRRRDYNDPSGNFTIEISDQQLLAVVRTTPKGEAITHYQGKTPLDLIRQISAASPAIQPDHIGYLGIELQRAYQCLTDNSLYIQDKH